MPTPSEMRIPAWYPCEKCGEHFELPGAFSLDYVLGETIICKKCGASLDSLTVATNCAANKFFLSSVLSPIGARSSWFKETMRAGQKLSLDFHKLGVPTDAKIVEINYTPQGPGFFPAECHSNTPQRMVQPSKVTLYPIPNDSNPSADTPLLIVITWIPEAGGDPSWQNLVEAFEAFGQERFSASIIPANVAIETKLGVLIREFLLRFSGGKVVDDFLDNAATYSHQLNALLPVLAGHFGVPKLPDEIRGRLNRLRGLRNDMAHEGSASAKLDRKAAAQLVVAALFAFRYLDFIKEALDKNHHA